MPEHNRRRANIGAKKRHITLALDATINREQVGPDNGKVADSAQRLTVTLKTGEVVDALEAAGVWRDLATLLRNDSAEFRSLLALAETREKDADSRHFERLWARDFLEMDHRTIKPTVRAVICNCYQVADEGPLIVPLRLHDEADREVAEWALAQADNRVRDFAFRHGDQGRSP